MTPFFLYRDCKIKLTRLKVKVWIKGLRRITPHDFYKFFSKIIQTGFFNPFKHMQDVRLVRISYALTMILVLNGFSSKSQISQSGARIASANLPNISKIKWEWAISERSTGDASVLDMAVDGLDNIYVTGYFGGDMEFGYQTIQSVGFYDIFVAKYNNHGNPIWIKGFESSNESYGSSIVLDDNDNL